jgi:hypothetical protein
MERELARKFDKFVAEHITDFEKAIPGWEQAGWLICIR